MTGASSDELEKAYGEISLGDLLHTLTSTQVGDTKETLAWAIEMLDLPLPLLTLLQQESKTEATTNQPGTAEDKDQTLPKDKFPEKTDLPDLPSDQPIPYGIVKTRRVEFYDQRPQWLESAAEIPPVTDAQIEMRPCLEPLFPPNSSRALISTAFATRRDEGAIDFLKLLERISNQQPITALPRQPISTLRFGVQLLIDRGQGTWPIYGDQERIRKEIMGVVGRDRVETLYFSDSPLRGLGPGSLRTWKLPYEPPAAGTPVVLLTDLGIARRRKPDLGATEAEWLLFAQRVRDAQCPLLALVPYAEHRWPSVLRETIYILPWDRPTDVSLIRRMVGHGLEVTQ